MSVAGYILQKSSPYIRATMQSVYTLNIQITEYNILLLSDELISISTSSPLSMLVSQLLAYYIRHFKAEVWCTDGSHLICVIWVEVRQWEYTIISTMCYNFLTFDVKWRECGFWKMHNLIDLIYNYVKKNGLILDRVEM